MPTLTSATAPKWSSHKPAAAKKTFGLNQANLNGNVQEEDADSCLNQKAVRSRPAGHMAATGRKAPCCLSTAQWRNIMEELTDNEYETERKWERSGPLCV